MGMIIPLFSLPNDCFILHIDISSYWRTYASCYHLNFFSSTCTKWTSIVLAIATFNLQWYLSALIRTFFLRKKYFWWIFTRIEIMLYCNMRRNAWHSHMLDLVHWPKAVSKSLLNIFFLFFLYLFPLC